MSLSVRVHGDVSADHLLDTRHSPDATLEVSVTCSWWPILFAHDQPSPLHSGRVVLYPGVAFSLFLPFILSTGTRHPLPGVFGRCYFFALNQPFPVATECRFAFLNFNLILFVERLSGAESYEIVLASLNLAV